MAMVIQISSQSLNNLGYQILAGMGGESMFVIAATLSGLGVAVMCPIGAKLGDIFGRSYIALIGGIFTFVLHTILAFIKDPLAWVICRTLIPFALGMFLSIPFTIPAEVYPETYSQKSGIVNAALALGIVVGSYGGGLLYDAGAEKFAVILAGIFALVGAVMIAASVPNRKQEGIKLDVMGVIWLFVFLTSLCLVLTFASSWGFGAATIIGVAVIIVSAVLLVVTEKKAESPCLPFKFFKNKTYLLLALFGLFASMYQYVIQVYTPMFGQEVLAKTTAQTGSWQVPRTIVCIIAPIVFAMVVKKTNSAFKKCLVVAGITTLICFAMLLLPGAGHSAGLICVALAVTGIGEGLRGISMNPLTITTLQPQEIGIGIGLMSAMGSIGAQVSAAIVGLVFNANVTRGLEAGVFSTYWTMIVMGVLSIFFILLVDTKKS